jgi:hypothetical protein
MLLFPLIRGLHPAKIDLPQNLAGPAEIKKAVPDTLPQFFPGLL